MTARPLCGALLLLLASSALLPLACSTPAPCSNTINGVVAAGSTYTNSTTGVYIHGCNNIVAANGTSIDGSDNVVTGNQLPAGNAVVINITGSGNMARRRAGGTRARSSS